MKTKTRKKALKYCATYQFSGDGFDAAVPLRAMAQFCKRHQGSFMALAVGIDYGDEESTTVTLTGEWDALWDAAAEYNTSIDAALADA